MLTQVRAEPRRNAETCRFRARLGSGREEIPLWKSMFLAAVTALVGTPAASASQRAHAVPASPAGAEVATAPALARCDRSRGAYGGSRAVEPQVKHAPEVTATLAGLYAAGKVKPGQIVQVVVQRGNRVTEVISNAPIPERRR